MVYFIVEAPYDKCFELFFKDELGYPNFYRMTELLPHDHANELILLTPSKPHEPTLANALSERAITVGVKHQRFGQGIQTGFRFHTDGMVQVQPEFKEALSSAVNKFIQAP